MTPQTPLTDEDLKRIEHEYGFRSDADAHAVALLLAHIATLQQQVEDERERCAKIADAYKEQANHAEEAEAMYADLSHPHNKGVKAGAIRCAELIAAAIRGGK